MGIQRFFPSHGGVVYRKSDRWKWGVLTVIYDLNILFKGVGIRGQVLLPRTRRRRRWRWRPIARATDLLVPLPPVPLILAASGITTMLSLLTNSKLFTKVARSLFASFR